MPPDDLNGLLQEALQFHRQGRLDDAEARYRRVLKLARDHFDALHLLGVLLNQRGRPLEALPLLTNALKKQPNSADALANFGMVLHALGRHAEGLRALDKVLGIVPDHVEALNNRGTLLLAMARPAEALATFDKLLALKPNFLQAQLNRATALVDLGSSEKALSALDGLLPQAPNHPGLHYNRGNGLRKAGREDEAIAAYDRALALAPFHGLAAYNRALALQALNRYREALAGLDELVAREPSHADAQFARSTSFLTLGDYLPGFQAYEWRWQRTGMDGTRRFRKPPWLGATPVAGKRIMLTAEQGLGDTIMFSRLAPKLAEAGATVFLEVQQPLAPVLRGAIPGVTVLAQGEKLPDFELNCPLASLPLALGLTAATSPPPLPLAASAASIDRWRVRLEAPGLRRIAIAWAGQVAHVNDANRSILLSKLAPLLATPGITFIGLQRDLRAGEAEALRDLGLVNVGRDLADFADTAAVLTLCDALITVDSAVAHLAGSLGVPTCLMVPYQPDWRWGLGDRSPWYPQIELFRQPQPRDWSAPIAALSQRLTAGPR